VRLGIPFATTLDRWFTRGEFLPLASGGFFELFLEFS